MGLKQFIKPTKITIILFLIFSFLSFMFFGITDTKIFACKVRPVLTTPIEFSDDFCGLGVFIFPIGIESVFTPIGYLTMFFVLLVLPYFLACGIHLIKKK
jgi:hypothetical protein